MDRAAIEELFAFTDYSWCEYERVLRPHGDETLTASAPGSGWPALRDALTHMNWAYVRWLADPAGTTDEPVEHVRSWDELDAYRRRVLGHARAYLDSLTDGALATPREMDVDGETLRYSPADIFVHALLHERQHHGDLNTLMYQLQMDTPIVEYRFSLPERRA
ncbi:MAG: DinB family protein [Actinobacteria bacterium]|nr:DinB family protein [Actinomycetota bacterium]